ncbi:MAG: FKBP-type peptidyl-prolyl cis-trans isomerase [Gemmatimonadaceae bacterium]
MSNRVFTWMAAVVLGTAACNDSTSPPPEVPLEQQVWASSLGIDLGSMTKLPSGVYYKDTVVGAGGTATATSTVKVYYTLWLANGTKVESNVGGATPASFPVASLIEGWKIGIPGMKVGGTRRLVIPSALAYGAQGSGSIPGNANLVFDIQLTGL